MLPLTNADRVAQDLPTAPSPRQRRHDIRGRVGASMLTLVMLSGAAPWLTGQRAIPARPPESTPASTSRAGAGTPAGLDNRARPDQQRG